MAQKWREFGAVAAILGVAVTFSTTVAAQDVIRMGISAPLSGPAASWGIGMEWASKRAAERINQSGGIKVGGKTYQVEILALDNKYNAGDGAKVAQRLLNREDVKFISSSLSTAAVQALQSLSERQGALLFTTMWGSSTKGPKFPLTFTLSNTPAEVFELLYRTVKEQNPSAKTVVLVSPNDATGEETVRDARRFWEAAGGIQIVDALKFERDTTEFQPIATKIAQQNPGILDLTASPPATAGIILKALAVQGWNGVKILGAGTGADALVKAGGDSANGVYMGLAADYDGAAATPVQRELNEAGKKALGEPLNVLHMAAYDGVFVVKAGIEAAGSLDPRKVAEMLPKIIITTSYGPTVFGGAAQYGSSQQFLVPVIVTQVKDRRVVELVRLIPEEAKQRIQGGKQ
jgi:branched-chain amino acid transport system substrate-binding protein